MKIIKGNLILKENTTIDEDLRVEGDVVCKGGSWNLTCGNLDCENLIFSDIAVAYFSFKCKSWKARRDNFIIKCLDGEIEIKEDKKVCDKCGGKLKNDK